MVDSGCIQGIRKKMVCVKTSLLSRLQEWTERNEGQLRSVIFKY